MGKEEALPQIGKYLRKQKASSVRQAFIETLEKEYKSSVRWNRFDLM